MAHKGIEFTQYTLVSQRRIMRWILRPDPIMDKSLAIRAAGGQFRVEETSKTEVRITCVSKGEVIAYKHANVSDREIVRAVDVVVTEAHKILVEKP
jgi:hypothetical protein